MAKKTKKETTEQPVVEQEIIETPVVESVVVEKPKKIKKEEVQTPKWEIRDRTYFLKSNRKPLSYTLKSSSIYWYDEEKQYERELKYTSNQRTPFVDEMVGDMRVEHVVFRNGALFVPKEKTVLQKMLSLYHPHRDSIYEEFKPQESAANELDALELEIEALDAARAIDVDMMEAIMRVELGSKVSDMSSKELKRDTLLYAKRNPSLFLELVNDDNVHLRNMGIKATEMGILSLSQDQRTFSWASNNRKLMNVPFDEHPYSALAAWFKTDEGMEVFKSIEKRLK